MMDPMLSETCWSTFKYFIILIYLLLLLSKALRLQRSFVLLNDCLPFGPVSDEVLLVRYFHPCYTGGA